jgi:hypothetical protein
MVNNSSISAIADLVGCIDLVQLAVPVPKEPGGLFR